MNKMTLFCAVQPTNELCNGDDTPPSAAGKRIRLLVFGTELIRFAKWTPVIVDNCLCGQV